MIMLGNLNIDEIEKRLGINFPIKTRDFMSANRQLNASNIEKGKWHCFDIPFHMVCGDMETAQLIYGSVKDMSGEVKEPLAFSISGQYARA